MVDNTIALQVKPLDIATPLMQAAKMRQMESEQQQQEQANNREQVASAMRGLAPYADSPEFAGRWAQTFDDLAAKGYVRGDIAAQKRSNPSLLDMQSVLRSSESPQMALHREQLAETTRQHNATMGMQQAQFAETQKQHGVTQGNVDREFAFKQREAEAAARGVDYREIDDGEGGKVLVKINKAGDSVSRVPIGGAPAEAKSPYAPTQKLTDDEAKSRGFSSRMVTAHNMITGNESINEGVGGYYGGVMAATPFVRDSHTFNSMASDPRQKSIQAQRNFVNALLRRESGAAISQAEFENAQRQYFPMPGDGAQVLATKRLNRQEAIEGVMQSSGRGYKPPPDYVGTKGPTGNTPAVKGADKMANDPPEISAAREAIAKGAPRAAVEQRLKQNGIKFLPGDLDL